jgi:hypothetical protein
MICPGPSAVATVLGDRWVTGHLRLPAETDQVIVLIGRSERIRTSDPLLPKQVRYQAAPRSAGLQRRPKPPYCSRLLINRVLIPLSILTSLAGRKEIFGQCQELTIRPV